MAKDKGLKTPQIEIILAQERFMARLGTLKEGGSFIWKGGSLILRLYQKLPTPRYTVDLDLLLRGIDFEKVEGLLKKASQIEVSDGFKFYDLKHTPMRRQTPYGGSRFSIQWKFYGKPRSQALNIDVCAGDTVNPLRKKSKDFFLLDIGTEEVSFNVYPPEYIFAEKLETIFRFKTGNTRVKDLIDLWTLIDRGLDVEPSPT